MEAMSMGVPAIGTHWGGNLDFMDEHNSYLIRCDEIPVPDSGWQATQTPSIITIRCGLN
jgi:hypothetical protein